MIARHNLTMLAFRPFEIQVLRLLASHALPGDTLEAVLASAEAERFDYTGSGYFLTVRNQRLPVERSTLSEPAVVGIAGDVQAGFVAFIGDHELTLECHTWGAVDVPANFREQPVDVQTPAVNVVDLRAPS